MASRLYLLVLLIYISCSIWGQEDRTDNLLLKNAEGIENFADSCLEAGDANSALKTLSKLTKIRKENTGMENADYARALFKISNCLSLLGNNIDALKFGTEAEKIQQKVLGTQNLDYATTLSCLAIYKSKLGKYEEALRIESKALEIKKKILGTKHQEYIISLGNLSQYYFKLGKYEEAIKISEKAINLQQRISGNKKSDYGALINNLAQYYCKIKNYTEAIRLGTEASEIVLMFHGVEHPNYATSLSNLAKYYSESGNYTEAIRLETEAMEIRKKFLGMEHPDYANSLSDLAFYNYSMNDFTEAIRFETEAGRVKKRIFGLESADYATSLHNLATYYFKNNHNNEAIKNGMDAMGIRKKVLGMEHTDYASSLNHLILYYSQVGNYIEAIRLCTEAIEIQKRTLGTKHPNYTIYLSYLAKLNYFLGNYTEAIRLENESMKYAKSVLGMKHPYYTSSMNNLAIYFSKIGNLTEAIKLENEVVLIRKETLGIDNPDYATSLHNLAIYYAEIGNYKDAIRLTNEAMKIRKKTLGINHPDYAASLNNLAKYNFDFGNYAEALTLGTESFEIAKRNINDSINDNQHYTTTLNNLAQYNLNLGNNDEAFQLAKEAYNILNVLNTKHPSYAVSLSNLASYYSKVGKPTEAIKLGIEVTQILKNTTGKEHRDYATSLSNLAKYYSENDNYAEAIRLETEAMEIRKKVLGMDHPDYANSLSCLAFYNYSLKNYAEAIIIGTKAVEIRKKNNYNDVASLHNLARYLAKTGNYFDAIKYEIEKMDNISSIIIENFKKLSSWRRYFYWNTIRDNYFDTFQSFVYKYPNPNLYSLLYDKSALFSKGVLLSTEIEMKEMILESKDSALIDDYQIIATNYETYNKQVNLPVGERCIDTDSLKQVIHRREDVLMLNSKVYGDYLRKLRLTWKDVQCTLSYNDIAIEFLSFPINNDSVMYVALTLRKESEYPKMITLFEEKQLKQVSDTLYYQCADMTDLVWKPLLPELQGVKNIYFSPSGALYNIGIEYLPGMDNYNIHRLSSTRELVTRKDRKFKNRAVLFGGLDYYANLDTLNKNKSITYLDETFVDHADVRSMGLRGGKGKLPHTKEEVENIANEFREANWTCLIDSASMGTEESFKALSKKEISTLHIATHGFYYTPEKAENTRYEFLQLDNHFASAEDKALTRSGLIMSGANHILEREKLPDDVEDGILTAKEIADVDLRGLDLVVLSACQTGLGDISQGEGVFGLQRGFKKAGASSILMSLWKVNDKATKILMIQFYKNWLAGQSKRQALLSAQKYLREVEGGKYNKPKYWAAFILLDGE